VSVGPEIFIRACAHIHRPVYIYIYAGPRAHVLTSAAIVGPQDGLYFIGIRPRSNLTCVGPQAIKLPSPNPRGEVHI